MNPPRVVEEDDEWNLKDSAGLNNLMVVSAKTPEHYPRSSPLLASPFAVRVSSFSSEDEDGDDDGVDDEAEEFIRRFYEQLRTQGRTQLLQYQEE